MLQARPLQTKTNKQGKIHQAVPSQWLFWTGPCTTACECTGAKAAFPSGLTIG